MRRGGSSPFARTEKTNLLIFNRLVFYFHLIHSSLDECYLFNHYKYRITLLISEISLSLFYTLNFNLFNPMKMYPKSYISIWWLTQFCVLFILSRHLGHLLIDLLLLTSIIGYQFGNHKTSIIASFGLAAYSIIMLIFTIILCILTYLDGNDFCIWLINLSILIIAITNIVISFRTIIKKIKLLT